MKIELLHNTPLHICSTAIRKCWASEDKSDSYSFGESSFQMGEKDKALIDKVGNKNKHSSTLEHLNYTFDIDGISRACLQELARHRHASLSVKSTRYTLKELKEEPTFYNYSKVVPREMESRAEKYLVKTPNDNVNIMSVQALELLRVVLNDGVSNDIAKYTLPEAYKTSLVWTINARSLQNFLTLRTSPSALWEIRELAYAIYKQLPIEHKYLFHDSLYVRREDD